MKEVVFDLGLLESCQMMVIIPSSDPLHYLLKLELVYP